MKNKKSPPLENNITIALSMWFSFVEVVKEVFQNFLDVILSLGRKYPNISQIIQLTFIYFFAVIDLVYSILSTVFALGYSPEILRPIYPLIQAILQSDLFRIWTSPEKIFFLSYVVIEFMVVRSIFNFSKLVRYNILLLFAILMLQGLMISYWDVLFHREIATPVAKWTFDQGALIFTDKALAVFFFLNTFIFFLFAYLYLYLTAIRGNFFTFSGMNWLTDSISFWLKVRTPSMRFGKRKRKK
jgi:hypothetical protein